MSCIDCNCPVTYNIIGFSVYNTYDLRYRLPLNRFEVSLEATEVACSTRVYNPALRSSYGLYIFGLVVKGGIIFNSLSCYSYIDSLLF